MKLIDPAPVISQAGIGHFISPPLSRRSELSLDGIQNSKPEAFQTSCVEANEVISR
jgi:hypothetical protein